MIDVSFEQATIKVDKVEEFGQLHRAIEEALSAGKVKGYLKRLDRSPRVQIRDFDTVIVTKTLEAVTGRVDLNARQLYNGLTLSDQAQIREFYLTKIEEVDPVLRRKFSKLYQYY